MKLPDRVLREIEYFEERLEKLRKQHRVLKFGFRWPWSRKLPDKLSLALYQLDARLYGKKSFFGNLSDQQVRELAARLRPFIAKCKLPFSPYPEGMFKNDVAVIGGALALVYELKENDEVYFYFKGRMGGPLKKKWIPNRRYLEDPLYDPRKYCDHYLIRFPLSEIEKIEPKAQIGKILYLSCDILAARKREDIKQ
jgi:hypothetical protein